MIKEWIAALRSGTYSQTKDTLHDIDGFCCLGVAAEVMDIASPPQMLGDQNWIYDELRSQIPRPIMNKGIEMNDAGYTFAEIANMIEKELAQ